MAVVVDRFEVDAVVVMDGGGVETISLFCADDAGDVVVAHPLLLLLFCSDAGATTM